MSEKNAVVFDVQRFSLNDGPGIRTIVFLKGCPLNCIWCHNPESKSQRSELMLYPTKCIGCGACVSSCPEGLHSFGENGQHNCNYIAVRSLSDFIYGQYSGCSSLQ